jgi:choline-glycine betaine transporter
MKSFHWLLVATLVLLGAAFVLSLSGGRTIEAVIIGLLAVPTFVLVAAFAYRAVRGSGPSR